jgi:hypothetical protein
MIGEVKQINLAVQSYQSRSSLSSSERLYNCFAENTIASSPLKTPAIFNIPAPDLWVDLENENDIYGFVVMNQVLYVVCGISLYSVTAGKNVTKLGDMATAPAPVEITENGLQVTILTNSGIAYYYDLASNTFAQITDANYQLANSMTTLDGYTIFSVRDSGEFFISANRDTRVYNALDFATAEALSDNIVKLIAFNRQLFIFGEASIEIWYNSGVGTPPFQRVDGALIQIGCIAKKSVCIDSGGIYFLGTDGIIYHINGYNPQRISTFGIEYQISKMTYVQDAIGFTYTQAGHKFYSLTFPTEKRTFVFDASTNLLHERGSFNQNQSQQINWSCLYGINFNNLTLVNSFETGKIYFLNQDKYEEPDGKPILMEVISALLFQNYNQFTVSNLILIMDSGVGLESPLQGSNPAIMLDFSIDGGLTWKNRMPASIGRIGNYRQKINFGNLGMAREFIFRFRISDPVKRSILGCFVQTIDGGI